MVAKIRCETAVVSEIDGIVKHGGAPRRPPGVPGGVPFSRRDGTANDETPIFAFNGVASRLSALSRALFVGDRHVRGKRYRGPRRGCRAGLPRGSGRSSSCRTSRAAST